MSAALSLASGLGSDSRKWFIPPTRAVPSRKQTAMHDPSNVEISTFGSSTTRYSPWTIGTRFMSGELAEDALDLFLQCGGGEGLHEIVVDAQRGRLLHDLAVRRPGQHDEHGLADHGILAHFL